MTGDQETMGDWGGTEHVPGEGLDDDPSPRGVVRAVLARLFVNNTVDPRRDRKVTSIETGWYPRTNGLHSAAKFDVDGKPLRVLDIGAGYGCWSSEMRRRAAKRDWPVHITGVELNAERKEHLRKWCDKWYTDDWRRFFARAQGNGWFWDIIIGNPPFEGLLRRHGEFPRDHEGALDPSQTMVGWGLSHAPAVLFLHTQQAFLKSEMGRAVQRAYPPAASWQVPGSVAFRGDGKADSRCYEATLFLRGHEGPCSRYLLPELPPEARRWTVPPGSESPDEARTLGLPMVNESRKTDTPPS